MTAPTAPIGWFEIAGSDLDKTQTFYGDLFNWTFNEDPDVPGYRIMDGGQGVSGGLTTAQAGLPRTYAIFSVLVPDVAATCGKIEQLSGKVLVGPETMDNGLVFANVEDPDGNHFGIFSPPAG